MRWYVLYLRPRCEKRLARLCDIYGIAYYLPLRRREARYQRMVRRFELPLFPGYLFARLTPGERHLLIRSNYVLRFMTPTGNIRLLRQLVQVRRALRANPHLQSAPRIEEGHPVRIVHGAFKGIQGVVRTLRNPLRVLLNVEMMAQAAVIQVQLSDIERL